MNQLQRIVAILALVVVSVYGGMKYHQYQTQINCEEQGGMIDENGVCVVKETIKERPNKEFLKNYKTVDGKYDLHILTAIGDPVNEIVVKNETTQRVFDLKKVESKKSGVTFQNEEGYFLRFTNKKFFWGHENVVLASGKR